ncbi:hypothetical protein V8E36_001718 [Tilletia maclaganii]
MHSGAAKHGVTRKAWLSSGVPEERNLTTGTPTKERLEIDAVVRTVAFQKADGPPYDEVRATQNGSATSGRDVAPGRLGGDSLQRVGLTRTRGRRIRQRWQYPAQVPSGSWSAYATLEGRYSSDISDFKTSSHHMAGHQRVPSTASFTIALLGAATLPCSWTNNGIVLDS